MILLEAKIDDIAAQYPEISELLLQHFQDVKPKYLTWSAKMLGQDPSEETASLLVKLTSQFEALSDKNKIKQKDINQYGSIEELYQAVDETSKVKSKTQQRKSDKSNSAVVLDDENIFIVVPKSTEASCYYGKNTKWCISGKENNQWKTYVEEDGNAFVFVIWKKTNEKFALLISQDGHTLDGVYDQEDDEIGGRAFWAFIPTVYHDAIRNAISVAARLQKAIIRKKNKELEKLRAGIEAEDPRYTVSIRNGGLRVTIGFSAHRLAGPAVITPDGTQIWFRDGMKHREDGPAVINSGGDEYWYLYDKLHRKDGPAITDPDGVKEWWQNGKRHREDGPAIIKPDGTQAWYKNGKLHRDGGPALIDADGSKEWYQHGELHRDDGPAITYPDGTERWVKNGNL